MKARVLFLCTGNSCRSQMAEGFLRHLGGGRFDAHSAGTDPSVVNPLAIAVMGEKGIDVASQRSKGVTEYLGQHFAYVVTVCDNAARRCPVFPGNAIRLQWSIEDPSESAGSEAERLPVFRAVRDQIERKIQEFLAGH